MSSEITLKNGNDAFGPDDDDEIELEVVYNHTSVYLTKQDLLEMLKMFEGEE